MRRLVTVTAAGMLAALVSFGTVGAASAADAEHPEPRKVRPEIREAREEFVKCLREQGVDVPEDEERRARVSPRELRDDDSEEGKKRRAAVAECRPHRGDESDEHHLVIRELSEEELEERRECLREQGVDVPEDEHVMVLREELDDADREALREAVEACGGRVGVHLDA